MSFVVVFALAAMLDVSAQATKAVAVTYADGEPRLWDLGTDLILRHADNASGFELISQKGRNARPQRVSYMSLRFATYRLDEIGGSFIENLLFVPQRQQQHALKLSWTARETSFVETFWIGGNEICAQIKNVETGSGRNVVRMGPMASMYCPAAASSQPPLMLTGLVDPFVRPIERTLAAPPSF